VPLGLSLVLSNVSTVFPVTHCVLWFSSVCCSVCVCVCVPIYCPCTPSASSLLWCLVISAVFWCTSQCVIVMSCSVCQSQMYVCSFCSSCSLCSLCSLCFLCFLCSLCSLCSDVSVVLVCKCVYYLQRLTMCVLPAMTNCVCICCLL